MQKKESIQSLYLSAEAAVDRVKNVFCVGRNYRDHARELGNEVPDKPMIFGKPTHAVVPARGQIRLPQFRSNIHHELEIVLWIKRVYEPGVSMESLVGGIGLGLDLTDRDAQSALKANGHPWEYAKGFKNSAVITDFYEVNDWNELTETQFTLLINGEIRQSGRARDMMFSFEKLVAYVGEHFGLNEGDLVFTGTPAGVGPLCNGDELEIQFNKETWATCSISRD